MGWHARPSGRSLPSDGQARSAEDAISELLDAVRQLGGDDPDGKVS